MFMLSSFSAILWNLQWQKTSPGACQLSSWKVSWEKLGSMPKVKLISPMRIEEEMDPEQDGNTPPQVQTRQCLRFLHCRCTASRRPPPQAEYLHTNPDKCNIDQALRIAPHFSLLSLSIYRSHLLVWRALCSPMVRGVRNKGVIETSSPRDP